MTPSPRGKGRPARGAPLLRSGLTRRGSAEYVVAAIQAASHGHRRRRSTMTDETDGRREFLKGALAVGGGAAALGAVGVPQAQAQPGRVPGTTNHYYVPATDKPVHWGYFSKSLKPVVEVTSGDFEVAPVHGLVGGRHVEMIRRDRHP